MPRCWKCRHDVQADLGPVFGGVLATRRLYDADWKRECVDRRACETRSVDPVRNEAIAFIHAQIEKREMDGAA